MYKLEERALAVHTRAKPDKRFYGIYLSKAGEALLLQLSSIAIESDLEATSALCDNERNTLFELLKKLYQDGISTAANCFALCLRC